MPPLLDPAGTQPVRLLPRPPERGAGPPGTALFHAGDLFSAVELQAMSMDGLVRRVYGQSYVRTGHPDDPVCRAQAAANAVPSPLRARVALGRQCAAWVYGCAPPPALVSVVTDHRRRTTALPPFSGATMHQVALGPFDINLVGGVPVTTPLRTALDIAVHGCDGSAVEVLRAIGSNPALDCPLRLVEAALACTRRVPGRTRALERIRRASGGAVGRAPQPETAERAGRCGK